MKCPQIFPGPHSARAPLRELASGEAFVLLDDHREGEGADGAVWLRVAFALGPADTGAAVHLASGVLSFFPLDRLVAPIELAVDTVGDDW